MGGLKHSMNFDLKQAHKNLEINDEDFGKTLTLNVKMQLSPRRAVYVKNKLIITSNNVYEMMIREKKAKKNNAFFDSSTVENLKK